MKKMILLVEKSNSCKKNSRSSGKSAGLVRSGHNCFPIVFQRISTSSWDLVYSVIHRNLKLTNLHLFSPTLKNYIITTTHHKNEILDGDEFCVLEVLIQRLFTC